jgi:thiamine monophosphate synthase
MGEAKRITFRSPRPGGAIRPSPPPPRRLLIWDPIALSDTEGRALQFLLEKDLPFDGVQIRLKGISGETLRSLLSNLIPLLMELRASGRILWVNRDLKLFHQLNAQGVQIGTEDPVPPVPYGLSIHSIEDLEVQRIPPPVFLLFGHIYETPSKEGVPPRGVEVFERVVKMTDIPVLAVGGITPAREEELIRRGAYGIATIRNFHLWEGFKRRDPV